MGLAPDTYRPASSTPGRLDLDERLIFQHFPKTAGTTLHNCLVTLFDPSEVCPERFGKFAFWPTKTLETYRFFSSHANTRQIQFIPGPVKVISFFRDPVERCISLYYFWRSVVSAGSTDMLEPAFARDLSPRDFFARTQWEQSRPVWNVYACGLAGDPLISPSGRPWRSETELLDNALARLEQLAFVGISEHMASSMDALSRQMDIPNFYSGHCHNVTDPAREELEAGFADQSVDVNDECIDYIMRANKLDKIIYDRALTMVAGLGERTKSISCLVGASPVARIRKGFRDVWVENWAGGCVLFGPYLRILPGRYAVVFRFRCRGNRESRAGGEMGSFDVVGGRGALVMARSDVRGPIDNAAVWSQELPFQVEHVVSDAEFRVFGAPGAPFDVELTVVLRYI
jgi:hypothetical protein